MTRAERAAAKRKNQIRRALKRLRTKQRAEREAAKRAAKQQPAPAPTDGEHRRETCPGCWQC